MRILLTNDDGVRAPGLQLLEEIALRLSDDVWIVAPWMFLGVAAVAVLTSLVTLRRYLRV